MVIIVLVAIFILLLCLNVTPLDATHKHLQTLSTTVSGDTHTPIYIIDNFLSPQECSNIIESTKDSLKPSTITRETDLENMRTSKTAHFTENHNLLSVEQKICNLLMIDKKFAERGQVQHYDVGNQFKPHMDYFHPGFDNLHLEGGQRVWTFMVYLNNVEAGGETNFIDLNVSVIPKVGRAVVWNNMGKDGSPNKRTIHEGSPVKAGVKDIITIWTRDKAQK